MSGIVVRIERLVLEGVSLGGADARRVGRSLERELARRLAEGGISDRLSGGIALPRMSVSAIDHSAGLTPAALGARVAGAVYHGIGR
jgi:hypothetical protein